MSRGDSGNFDLEGTNGPASLGVNTLGQSIDLVFDSQQTFVCFDLGTAFFEQLAGSPDVSISAFLNGQEIESEQITLIDTINAGEGTWITRGYRNVDRVRVTATSGTALWAMDNIIADQSCGVDEDNNDNTILMPILGSDGTIVIVPL